jgi:hypothetical protein
MIGIHTQYKADYMEKDSISSAHKDKQHLKYKLYYLLQVDQERWNWQ